jgi:hypothetical protein
MDPSIPPQADHSTAVGPNAAKVIDKINDKVMLLKTSGLITGDRDVLKNRRLRFVWEESNENDTRPVTPWRHSRARSAYRRIQDVSNHLFLAVVLAITPTECGKTSFDEVLEYLGGLKDYKPYHFNLNSPAKIFFKEIAAEQEFAGKHRYVNFMQSLFPEELSRK